MHDTSGNVAILAALCLPVALGAAGIGLDTLQWTLTQRQLQREADSAAIAGALAKVQGRSATDSANLSLGRDNLVALSQAPLIEPTPTVGPYKDSNAAVRVVLRSQKKLPFSSMFMKAPPLIAAEATAAAITNGKYCVISLENQATTGITLQGSATVDMGCGMATNSPAATAIYAGGSSTVVASPVGAVGGVPNGRNYATGTVLLPHTLPQKDPFSSLPSPTVSGCAASLNVSPNTTKAVANPTGVSCYKGMDLKGTVTFAPGTYYIDGSNLSVGAQAAVTGTGVTFVLTSNTAAVNPSSIATININGGATVKLTAPKSGTFAGVLFYQDRRAPNASTNLINGNASSRYEGSMYLPSQGVSFSGDSGMDTRCVQIVARRVTFIGNTTVENDCPDDGAAKAFFGARVLLVG